MSRTPTPLGSAAAIEPAVLCSFHAFPFVIAASRSRPSSSSVPGVRFSCGLAPQVQGRLVP